jgi:hypothetical protein
MKDKTAPLTLRARLACALVLIRGGAMWPFSARLSVGFCVACGAAVT